MLKSPLVVFAAVCLTIGIVSPIYSDPFLDALNQETFTAKVRPYQATGIEAQSDALFRVVFMLKSPFKRNQLEINGRGFQILSTDDKRVMVGEVFQTTWGTVNTYWADGGLMYSSSVATGGSMVSIYKRVPVLIPVGKRIQYLSDFEYITQSWDSNFTQNLSDEQKSLLWEACSTDFTSSAKPAFVGSMFSSWLGGLTGLVGLAYMTEDPGGGLIIAGVGGGVWYLGNRWFDKLQEKSRLAYDKVAESLTE